MNAYVVTDLLFQAFKAIFISPTSADVLENENPGPSSGRKCCWGDRQTRTNMAKLIGMQMVQPCTIAYVACQVNWSFATDMNFNANWLLDCLIGSFCPVLCGFLGDCWWCIWHPWVLWGNSGVVRKAKTKEDKKFIDEILLWWNRWVLLPFRVINGSNWRVQDGIWTDLLFLDWTRWIHSEVCGEVAEEVPCCYWWTNCCLDQTLY